MVDVSPAVGSKLIVVGIIELVAAIVCFIIGMMQETEYSRKIISMPNLLTLLYIIPAVLSIVVGKTRNKRALGSAIFLNAILIALSGSGAVLNSLFWASTNNGVQIPAKMATIFPILTMAHFILFFTSCVGCCVRRKSYENPVSTNVTIPAAQQTTSVINVENSAQYALPTFNPVVPERPFDYDVPPSTGLPPPSYEELNFFMLSADDKPPVETAVY